MISLYPFIRISGYQNVRAGDWLSTGSGSLPLVARYAGYIRRARLRGGFRD
jgi:hypothetical protein